MRLLAKTNQWCDATRPRTLDYVHPASIWSLPFAIAMKEMVDHPPLQWDGGPWSYARVQILGSNSTVISTESEGSLVL